MDFLPAWTGRYHFTPVWSVEFPLQLWEGNVRVSCIYRMGNRFPTGTSTSSIERGCKQAINWIQSWGCVSEWVWARQGYIQKPDNGGVSTVGMLNFYPLKRVWIGLAIFGTSGSSFIREFWQNREWKLIELSAEFSTNFGLPNGDAYVFSLVAVIPTWWWLFYWK